MSTSGCRLFCWPCDDWLPVAARLSALCSSSRGRQIRVSITAARVLYVRVGTPLQTRSLRCCGPRLCSKCGLPLNELSVQALTTAHLDCLLIFSFSCLQILGKKFHEEVAPFLSCEHANDVDAAVCSVLHLHQLRQAAGRCPSATRVVLLASTTLSRIALSPTLQASS